MSADDEKAAGHWVGAVRLWRCDRLLGVLHVDLHAIEDSRSPDLDEPNRVRAGWAGRVNGSDYLVWGANLTKTQIEFPSGERAEVVLRSGGRLQGLGPAPETLRTPGP